MGRIPSAPALDRCDSDPIEHCPAPSPDVQEEGDHRSLHRGGHLERPLSSFTFTCARGAFPEHYFGAGRLLEGRVWRAPALCGKREERGGVPTSRSPGNSLKLAAQRRAG